MRFRVQYLASLSGLRVVVSCGVGCRCSLDPELLLVWLWHRPVATTLIGLLAWEPPYAMGVALEKTKRQKQS